MQKAYLFLVLFLLARVSLGQTVSFSYDASGNRTSRSASSGPIYSLSVSGQTGLSNVVSNGGSGSFVVNSTNVNWSISNLPSWASVSQSSGGNGSTTVTVTVTGNSSTTARTQALSITGANASTQSLTISQVGASGGGGCPTDEVAIGTSGTNIVCIKHWNNNYVLCEKYVSGSTTHYIPRGKNYWYDWSNLSRYANVDQYYSCIDESSTGWWGLVSPLATNYTIAGWTRGEFSDGTSYYIQNASSCTSPAPSLSSSSGNGYVDLTATGCNGTVTWSPTGSTGTTLRVNNTDTYSATCTQSGCTPSPQSSISVTVTSSSGCPVDEVTIGTSGTNIVCIKHWNNNYVLCEKYVSGSTTHYIVRGKNYWYDWSNLSRYANVDQYYGCIDESSTGWWGLVCPLPTNYTIVGWTRGEFSDGTVYYTRNVGTSSSIVAASRIAKEEIIQVESETSTLKVSPNPTQGAIKVEFDLSEEQPIRLSIVDIHGNTIGIYDIDGQLGHNELPIDLQKEQAGVYFVRLPLKNKQLVSKVIKVE